MNNSKKIQTIDTKKESDAVRKTRQMLIEGLGSKCTINNHESTF